MTSPAPGQVITFYSYKGGTGRSMALANTGYLLAIRQATGKPVLMIDWDLEAPGLHRYFGERMTRRFGTGPTAEIGIDAHPGLIDLFGEIRTWLESKSTTPGKLSPDLAPQLFASISLDRFLIQTDVDSLQLLKAGTFGPAYSTSVNTFHWDTLFALAPWLFAEFARELTRRFAYVLIDSRTGLTDVSGVCTMLMPEKLVVVFTPNRQSLYGALDLVRTAAGYRRKSNDLRPLLVYPLPSRVETAVKDLQENWRKGILGKIRGYQPEFEALVKELYGVPTASLSDYFDAVLIPHVPKYAYGEEIASMEESSTDVSSSAMNYGLFVDRLLRPAPPWQDPHLLPLKNVEADYVLKAEEIYARCPPARQEIAKHIFERLVRLARTDEGGQDSYLVVQRSDLPFDSDAVINLFAEAGLLSVSDSGVRIAQDGLIKDWPRLRQWLDEDKTFLLWRQGMRTGMVAWEQNKRQPSYLLSGAQLLEAETHLAARRDDLNDPEIAYIAQSREQYNLSLALSLSSYATHELQRPTAPDSIQRGVLLAAESFRRSHALEGDQALRQGLGKLARPLFSLKHDAPVEGVLMSNGGAYLASRDASNMIRMWATASGEPIASWAQTVSIHDWRFSPDDKMFAWLVSKNHLEIRLEKTGAAIISRDFAPPVHAMTLSNESVAIAMEDQVSVFDPLDIDHTLQSFALPKICTLAFLERGRALVAGSESGEVILLSLDSQQSVRSNLGEIVRQVSGLDDLALSYGPTCLMALNFQGEVSRSLKGLVLATGGRMGAYLTERSIVLWDALLNKEVAKIRNEDKVSRVSLSASGTLMATSGENVVRVYDTGTGQELQRAIHDEPVMQTSLDRAGLIMASRTRHSKQAYLWDVSREPPGVALNTGSFVWDVSFNSAGTLLAAASKNGNVNLFNFPSGSLVRMIQHNEVRVTSVAFSTDDRLMSTAAADGRVRIFETGTGLQIASFDHESCVAVAFAPQGHLLASSGRDGHAIFWDLRSHSEVFRIAHPGYVWHVTFDREGLRAATACEDGTARIIDVSSGKLGSLFKGPASIRAVAFQPTRAAIATAGLDGAVRLFLLATGSEIATFPRQGEITSVAFSPDEAFIAVGAADDSAQIWRVADKTLVGDIHHNDSVNWVAFSPDGKYLATACSDGFVRACLWRPKDLIQEACLRAGRSLSQEEWTKYLPEEPYFDLCAKTS